MGIDAGGSGSWLEEAPAKVAGDVAGKLVAAAFEEHERETCALRRPPFSCRILQAGGSGRERGSTRGAGRVAGGAGVAAAGGGWLRGAGSGSRESRCIV